MVGGDANETVRERPISLMSTRWLRRRIYTQNLIARMAPSRGKLTWRTETLRSASRIRAQARGWRTTSGQVVEQPAVLDVDVRRRAIVGRRELVPLGASCLPSESVQGCCRHARIGFVEAHIVVPTEELLVGGAGRAGGFLV